MQRSVEFVLTLLRGVESGHWDILRGWGKVEESHCSMSTSFRTLAFASSPNSFGVQPRKYPDPPATWMADFR